MMLKQQGGPRRLEWERISGCSVALHQNGDDAVAVGELGKMDFHTSPNLNSALSVSGDSLVDVAWDFSF